MNDKIKRFSFGAENIKSGQGRCARIVTPELVVLSIEDRTINKKLRRLLIVSLHYRMISKASWMPKDLIEFSLEGEDLMDGILHTAITGYKCISSNPKETARQRLFIPIPLDYERFAELRAPTECTEVECADGKIAFKMPW